MKVWITYAWTDNRDGDFDYLVQELEKVGVTAYFDRTALVPGHRLWQQIGELITKGDYHGWAYLVTPASLASEPCKEELEYAVNRALREEERFPIIGLIHGVSFNDLPASLRTRLCISLSSPDWTEQIKASLKNHAPARSSTNLSKYVIKRILNGKTSTIYEISPRFGEIHYWCIAVPTTVQILNWGEGLADGTGAISSPRQGVMDGTVTIHDISCSFRGSGTKLTPGTAAKIEIAGGTQDFIVFGESNQAFDIPTKWELV